MIKMLEIRFNGRTVKLVPFSSIAYIDLNAMPPSGGEAAVHVVLNTTSSHKDRSGAEVSAPLRLEYHATQASKFRADWVLCDYLNDDVFIVDLYSPSPETAVEPLEYTAPADRRIGGLKEG